jgi:hypothetical protein
MVAEQEMDEKWEVTESLILSDVLITVSMIWRAAHTLSKIVRPACINFAGGNDCQKKSGMRQTTIASREGVVLTFGCLWFRVWTWF